MADAVNNLPIDAIVKSTPLDGLEQSFRIDTPARVDNRGIDISVATGLPSEETTYKMQEGDNSPVQTAKNSVGDVVGDAINTSIAGQIPVDQAAQIVAETQEKKAGLDGFNDFILESALTVDDPNYNPLFARALTNQQIGFEMISERFANAQEQGLGSTILDFVDRFIIRQIPIGAYEDVTKRSETKGRELAVAAATMSPDEYRDFYAQYLDDLAEEGFFTSENYFAFEAGMNELMNGGFDPDANFNAALGIVDLVPLAGAALKGIGKGGKVLGRVGALKGPKAADKAVERLSEAGALKHPEVADEMLPTASSLSKETGNISGSQSKVSTIFRENKLLGDIQELYRSGTFGRMATPVQIDEAAGQIAAKVKSISSRPMADMDVVDLTGLGDFATRVKLGKLGNGDPYQGTTSGLANANKAANNMRLKGLAADVVPVDPSDVRKGYYIQIEEAMDLTRAGNALDVANVSENLIARALGSTRAVDDLRLNTLANMAESGQGAIREVVMPYLKPLEQLKYDSKIAIGQVFRELRDGEDAFIREGYSDTQFRTKFKKYHPKGAEPTDADYDAFWAAKTVNDTAYVLQANKLASRYVNKGYKAIEFNGQSFPAKKVAERLPDDTVIFDRLTNKAVYSQDLADDVAVWKLDRELEGGIGYATRPSNVRSIQYEDVLNYNAGGRRVNPDANYFVTANEAGGRAFLTAFTETQARLAASQMDTLFRAIRATGRGLDNLGDELDDLVAKNSDWNPDIVNTQDLVALIKKKGWDVEKNLSYKARDGRIEGVADDLYEGMTQGEYVRATHARSDDTLMEFGGKETFNENPIKAMVDQLSDTTAEYSFRNYNYNAKAGWLKARLGVDKLPAGTDVNALFRETTEAGTGANSRKLRIQRAIIERRETQSSDAVEALQDFGAKMQEYVFDKTGRKIPVKGAEGLLLNVGFRSAFGFMNISQLFLQATHAAQVVAISPRAGALAASHILPFRLAMNTGDAGAKALAFKRLAKTSGLDEKFWQEYDVYLRTSGRKMIENDAIEKGTGAGYGVSWWEGSDLKPSTIRKGISGAAKVVKKADEIGLMPFNEGERLSRHTGIMTAAFEFRKQFPGVSLLSDEGRAWITRREQDLTFNMTTASRGAWQAGLFKVPTQWLSYSMRTMEAVVLGGGLSVPERIRMASMMTMMSGVGGLGLGAAADQISEMFGVEPDSPAFVGLKYGMIDGMLSWGLSEATGEDIRTAFGTRIAPLTAFTDLYRKVTEESAVAALAGPSGEIAGGAASAVFNAFMGSIDLIVNGGGYGPETFAKDMTRVLRTPSGIDNVWKAAEIMRTGVYRSKSGTTLPMEFSDVEGIMQGLGVTNFKVAEYYDRKGRLYRNDKEFKSFRKQLDNDFRLALARWKTDPEGAKDFMDEIGARIEFSGFSPVLKAQLRRNLARDAGNDTIRMAMELIQQDNVQGAKVIESLN